MAVDLGIDLGTSTTLICNDSGEILLNEPSLVIRSDTSAQPVAIGSAASDMIGRTPEGVSAIMPVGGIWLFWSFPIFCPQMPTKTVIDCSPGPGRGLFYFR